MSQPFALPLKILYHRIIEKEINKCGEINARSVKSENDKIRMYSFDKIKMYK